jgi:hypothetical protein
MKPDLVEDIRACPEIMAKIREENGIYAQNLYAAWCNMQWGKRTVWGDKAGDLSVLSIDHDNLWSASWRASGGIVANLRNKGGDYMDYYCSGIRNDGYQEDLDIPFPRGYVSESDVTDEIKEDLGKLGWFPVPYDDNFV